MNILRGYKYLLYRIYQWQLAWFGKEHEPKYIAIVGCSLFLFINILTLKIIFQLFSGYRVDIPDSYVIIFMIFSILLNSYIFLYLGKFEVLIKEFSKESEARRKKNTIWCFVYVVSTHIAFYVSVFILSPSSH